MTSDTYLQDDEDTQRVAHPRLFATSWDRGMWILNSILVIFLGGITATLLVSGLYALRENTFCAIIVIAGSLLPALILTVGAAFAPRQYQITDDSILVRRLFAKNVKIPLAEVLSLQPVSYKYVFKKSVRIMGSGGGFGIYGDFTSPSLKYFKAYMTRRDKLVLITTTDKPFVLTPDDMDGFIAAVRKSQNKPRKL